MLPGCPLRSANDSVNVVLGASINGYASADSSFDNCTYWHAVEASTGPAAMPS
jgi:hypothetical protein